ncbi:hypothetical protein [Hymenobacter cheonanensis]|uniref:hypothetical protein n=1 Tax=Hymenobacter sp. CA2-7 TaxID=3063993 RepID=UPI002712F394|nr:hypothetical protein [Hymenobacter sp. CA2-7]MDO7888198.1 hypothetical protein [Hymenobacter sp. CA2-7]
MPFFERPLIVGGSAANAGNNLSLLVYPAKKVPSVMELGILVKEGVKRRATTIGILSNEKVTRRDSGCGEFTPTGTLLKLTKNDITVDPVEIKLQECADDYTETVLESALKDGHAEDNNLEGTVIETIVRKALTEGLGSLSVNEAGQLDMAIEPVLTQQVSGVVYLDGYRMWLLGDRTSSDPNYNQTDGIRKKLIVANPTPSSKGTTGTYRGAAMPTAAALKADPTLILGVLGDLYENCSEELQDQDDAQKAFYLDTKSYRAVRLAYRALVAGKVTEESNLSVIAGSQGQRFTYEGVELIELKSYSRWVAADLPNGTSQCIAIYTVRENLVWATDLISDMAEVKFWYDINTEFNRTRVKYRIGAGFGFDILMAYAL